MRFRPGCVKNCYQQSDWFSLTNRSVWNQLGINLLGNISW